MPGSAVVSVRSKVPVPYVKKEVPSEMVLSEVLRVKSHRRTWKGDLPYPIEIYGGTKMEAMVGERPMSEIIRVCLGHWLCHQAPRKYVVGYPCTGSSLVFALAGGVLTITIES